MAKANYEKPASQVDLEARQKSDYVSPSILQGGSDAEPSTNGYVNVDHIYQNFAEETHKPFMAEKGPESKVEAEWYADDVDLDAAATPDGEGDAVREGDEEAVAEQNTPSSTSPAAAPQPS